MKGDRERRGRRHFNKGKGMYRHVVGRCLEENKIITDINSTCDTTKLFSLVTEPFYRRESTSKVLRSLIVSLPVVGS